MANSSPVKTVALSFMAISSKKNTFLDHTSPVACRASSMGTNLAP
jgi:hypothetical protein